MRLLTLIAASWMISAIAASQYTSGPPVCFAFNDTGIGSSISMVSVPFGIGALTVHFTALSSATVDTLDVLSAYVYTGSTLVLDLYPTVSLGGATSGPPIASMSGGVFVTGPIAQPAWFRCTPGNPVALTGGATYALLIGSIAGGVWPGCVPVGLDAAGTQPLPYQLANSAVCPAAVPASGQLPFSLRFRGASCGPGPGVSASVAPLGSACGSFSGVQLFTTLPPMLGYPWPLTVFGPYGETAYVFWSVGVNSAGVPIPGAACGIFLDPVSLQSLYVLGAEPIASGPVTMPYPYGGAPSATWWFTVPASPALAGAIVGAQALIVGPTGTISLGGGTFGHVTNALVLTLGY